MPKLLSRSKHEEFKSNSTLQIKDQKERRAKCEEKHHYRKASPASTVPSSSTVPPAARSCFSRYTLFAFAFGFFHFTPIITFRFWFFCNFPYTEHLYKPRFVQIKKQTSLRIYSKREAVSPQLPFPFFFPFLFHFLGCQTLL